MAPLPRIKRLSTCRIHTAVESPSKVMALVMDNTVLHLYRPGASVCPLRMPAWKFNESGPKREATSVYAISMSLIAVVSLAGVGGS